MSLDRYRRPRLIILPPHATAYEAARAMAEHRIATILVGDSASIAGFVTDRDLVLEVIAADLVTTSTPLAQVMSEPPVTIDVGARPDEAALLMRHHGCRRLLVTEDGLPVGVVTLDDLIQDSAIDLEMARSVVAVQLDDAFPDRERMSPEEARVRVRQRHKARAEGSLHRLLRAVERAGAIHDHARAERALGVVLGAICRRLTPDEARHFIAQLPSKLHPDLIECLDGPDKRITAHTIENELRRELDLDDDAAAGDLLEAVCAAVADSISTGGIEAVRAQLPSEMKALFATAA
jgi:CBS domain-containing protein